MRDEQNDSRNWSEAIALEGRRQPPPMKILDGSFESGLGEEAKGKFHDVRLGAGAAVFLQTRY